MRILLAINGSPCSDEAIAEVARCDWPRGSVVKIVSVAEPSFPAAQTTASLTATQLQELEEFARNRASTNVDRAIARLRQCTDKSLQIETEVITGSPKEVIVESADLWGADLLIVGSRGYRTSRRYQLGSVSQSVATRAACSVHLVRCRDGEAEHSRSRKILLAIDGSACSDAAVRAVVERRWPDESEVRVIHVVDSLLMPSETLPPPSGFYQELEKGLTDHSNVVIKRAQEKFDGKTSLHVSTDIRRGNPAFVILKEAEEWGADLIVLGSHGVGGMKKLWLGKVAHSLLQQAKCSVEIVRSRSIP